MKYKVTVSWKCDRVTDYNFSIDSRSFIVDDLDKFLVDLPNVIKTITNGTILNIQIIKVE